MRYSSLDVSFGFYTLFFTKVYNYEIWNDRYKIQNMVEYIEYEWYKI